MKVWESLPNSHPLVQGWASPSLGAICDPGDPQFGLKRSPISNGALAHGSPGWSAGIILTTPLPLNNLCHQMFPAWSVYVLTVQEVCGKRWHINVLQQFCDTPKASKELVLGLRLA